jgi:hypothetical protein
MIVDHAPAYVGCQAIDPSCEAYFIEQRNTPAPSTTMQSLAGETLKRMLICARNRPDRQTGLSSKCRELVIV